jgi:hypothetical protein
VLQSAPGRQCGSTGAPCNAQDSRSKTSVAEPQKSHMLHGNAPAWLCDFM